jgi:hypothetical protein
MYVVAGAVRGAFSCRAPFVLSLHAHAPCTLTLLHAELLQTCAGHLRPGATFYPKVNFQRVVEKIPSGALVLMLFCEIDCREGIVSAVAKGRYQVTSAWVLASPSLPVSLARMRAVDS